MSLGTPYSHDHGLAAQRPVLGRSTGGLVVASNRLPVTLRHGPDGLSLSESVGGVATGMRSLQQGGRWRWIGWPGPTDLLPELDLEAVNQLLRQHGCVPVHLSREEVRGFYQGFANGVIWPLFHYLVQQIPLYPRHFEVYDAVNRRFAERIAEEWRPGDAVWIHDYQLLRVPLHLRQLCPEAPIGLFLHIPFPALEIYRVLPVRRQLLEGMLHADLLGFHTEAYAEHFGAAATDLVGAVPLEPGGYEYEGRRCTVGVFPMGIDVGRFEEGAGLGARGPLRTAFTTGTQVKALLAIDRLDYTKGIPRRLLAFNRLLGQHPELRERVTLIQIAVPSRTGVRAYRRFRRHVDAMVGRINGAYGTPGWTPVQYLYRAFSQPELLDFYRQADVMLVTPVRDGMNLVAKEFVASRSDTDGVLVLSEFAGAAAELREAILVNPYDIEGCAEAYYRALVMPRHERRARMRALRGRVRACRVEDWAESFLKQLEAARQAEGRPEGKTSPDQVTAALGRIRSAEALLLLLDYDGTLVPYAPTPDEAQPDAGLLELLESLTRRPRTELHVVSGRSREVLEAWLGHLPIGLHAEHGTWSRLVGAHWVRHEGIHPVPYDELLALLKHFTGLTPGSLIERKSAGLAWHFRLASAEQARVNAELLIEEVRERFPRESVDILRGEQVLEFRPSGIHKGLVVTRLLPASPSTLTVAVGDDTTDEDMFAALGERGVSVHVGPRPSGAQVCLRDVAACRLFLRSLLAPEMASTG